MLTNHVDRHIEAYLDSQLSPKKQQQVEQHLAQCLVCERRLSEARRLQRELGSTMHAALGQPAPPSHLRRQVWQSIQTQKPGRMFSLDWMMPFRVLNAAGTVAVVALLAFGAYAVIQGQIPGAGLLRNGQTTTAAPASGGSGDEQAVRATAATAVPSPQAAQVTAPTATAMVRSSMGDTLPPAMSGGNDSPAGVRAQVEPQLPLSRGDASQTRPAAKPARPAVEVAPKAQLPGGTLAFALFDGAMYNIHLISPDGSNHRVFSQIGVSEPALHPAETNDFSLAFRSWNDPEGPRTLVSSDWQAERPEAITHFWEDAQPDWSPTENRIIFASQRESDRRWRLYSVWGDGSQEFNLRLEGKSPTFAPDGKRFAFESCDESGVLCGLWAGSLENSEFGAEPLLVNPLAKSPDWSPVAEQIVYMANPNGNWDLYQVNSDGRNVRRLTDHPAIDGLPVYSADGKWVAFVSNRGGQWGLWLLNISSGSLYQTVTFEDGSLIPLARAPYNQHDERWWWDEQISWGP